MVFILNFSFKIFVEWGNPFWIPFGEVEVPDTKPSNPILFPSPFTHKTLSKNKKKSIQKITLKNYHKNTAPPPIKHEMPPTWESPLVRNQLNVMTWVFFAAKKPPRNPWPPKGARLVKRGQCPKRQNSPWRILKVVVFLNQGRTLSVWVVWAKGLPLTNLLFFDPLVGGVILIGQIGTFPKRGAMKCQWKQWR